MLAADLGAYGEGNADALTAIWMKTPCMGRSFFVGRKCERDLRDPSKIFPVSDPDAHIRGMPLAAAWYELLQSLEHENQGQEIVLRLYLLSLLRNRDFMTSSLVNFVLQADCDLYEGNHLSQIRQAFAARWFIIDQWAQSLTPLTCR